MANCPQWEEQQECSMRRTGRKFPYTALASFPCNSQIILPLSLMLFSVTIAKRLWPSLPSSQNICG